MAEEVVWCGRRSVASLWPWWLAGVLTIWVLGLGLVFAGVGLWKLYARRYEVTSERVRATRGLVSHSISEADLDRITDVVVEQGVVGRVLNFGTLYFNTAGGGGYEIVFYNVDDPKGLKERVRQARKK
jgi:uncharacterized membrane protein YdbT with pleckstrin-like domain